MPICIYCKKEYTESSFSGVEKYGVFVCSYRCYSNWIMNTEEGKQKVAEIRKMKT